MKQIEIPPQNCLCCAKDSGTKIICDECRPTLTKSQIQKFDAVFQRIVIELFDNECVDCGLSAETESGELAADHLDTKGSDPTLRYDLSNAVCRCGKCHPKRHTGEIPVIPKKTHKLPRQTQERAKKRGLELCERCRVLWAMPGKKICWKC